MQVQLYHNPRSGSGGFDSGQLISDMEAAGHSVTPLSIEDRPADGPCDLVAIAGGDGTVEKVLRRHYWTLLARRVPIAIIPVGTANNIAWSLGIPRQPKWLLDLSTPDLQHIEKKLALGVLVESSTERYFVESVGCGALAELIRKKDSPAVSGPDVRRHIEALLAMVRQMEPFDCQLIIDGRDYSSRYLLMEIMNTNRAGPGLTLAPDANPGDQYFRMVLIAGAEKDLLADYLTEVMNGANPVNPFFRVTGKRVEFSSDADGIHVDDTYLNNKSQCRFSVQAGTDPLLVVD